jgi:hypothetical protein
MTSLTAYVGEAFLIDIYVKDSAGEVVDLSTATLTANFRANSGGLPIAFTKADGVIVKTEAASGHIRIPVAVSDLTKRETYIVELVVYTSATDIQINRDTILGVTE